MGKRLQRIGIDLEMEVLRICARELMRLPEDARQNAVDWLQKRVVPRQSAGAPVVPDPNQPELFPGG